MRKEQNAKDQPQAIKSLLQELGRLRSIRDPIGDLANGLTSPQIHAILWLGQDGPLSPSVLAQRIGCMQPSVTGVVDRLAKLGYVERERDTNDRRIVHVKLTRTGTAIFKKVDAEVTTHLENFLSILSTADRAAVVRSLGRLVEIMKMRAGVLP